MKLYVDLGNSYIKWALSDREGDVRSDEESPADPAAEIQLASNSLNLPLNQWHSLIAHNQWLLQGTDQLLFSQVLVSSVSQNENLALLLAYMKQHFSIECTLQKSERCWQSLHNAYVKPERMGVDRWLAMIAAWHKYHQACLVVDCGTAITIDAIDESGQHLGGHIVPGIQLLQKMLTGATAQVKMFADDKRNDEADAIYGHSTSDAVTLGCQFMIRDYLQNRWQQFHKAQQNGLLLITGGDGLEASSQLDMASSYHRDLVLQGLYIRHQ